ncbi:MAG TPA: MATE family efflux transporter [Thermoplasmata archaeon]|nr:MATE family efflux transporter [Thermoplasmata archaeon]
MAGGPPRRTTRGTIFALAWPVIVANFLQTFTTFVDMLVVGHLPGMAGIEAQSAIGAGSQILFLNFSLMVAISAGTVALVAREIGAGNPKAAAYATKQSLLLGVLLSLPLAAVEIAFAEPLVQAITTNSLGPAVVSGASAYLRIVVAVTAFQFVMLLSIASLRGAGDTRTAMYVGAAVNVLNIAIVVPLVFGLGPVPSLGVVGAATGTAIATVIGALLFLAVFLRGRTPLRLQRAGGLDWAMSRRLLRVGVPAGVESLLFQVGITIWIALVSGYGTQAYAAHFIGLRVQSLAFMPGFGLSVAASALVGQNLGARNPDEAYRSGIEASKIAVLLMGGVAALNFLLAPFIAAAFTPDVRTQELTVLFIRIHALSIPAVGLYFSLDGALKGAGDTRYPLFTSVVGIFLVRLPLAFALGFAFVQATWTWSPWIVALPLGLAGIWLALPVEYCVRSVLISRRFRSGRWKSITV